AKSRKKGKNPLTKDQHGQLLVSQLWFTSAYSGYAAIRVSVHPNSVATRASVPIGVKALTLAKLQAIVDDARQLLTALCDSQVSERELVGLTDRLLAHSNVRWDKLPAAYLVDFEVA
ncbi:Helicase superfamily, partial [mine drainage metagenome]